MRTKRDPKQLLAVDVAIVISKNIGLPTIEPTARALAHYFRSGGRSLGYAEAIGLAVAHLCGHITYEQALREISQFPNVDGRAQCQEVLDAIIAKYGTRISHCVPIASQWVKVRGGIGLRLPPAILAKVDGVRRFVIFQPRRGKAPFGDRAGFYLSLFNEHHSKDEEYDVRAEMLDMQCPRGQSHRKIQIIASETSRQFTKKQIDDSLAVYASAMERLVGDPTRYGVRPDISREIQGEMDEIW